MPLALATNALTTLATVKGLLGITDMSQDDLITRLINSASQWIENYCSRKFAYGAQSERKAGYGSVYMFLDAPPLDTNQTITVSYLNLYGSVAQVFPSSPGVYWTVQDAQAAILYRPGGWLWTTTYLPGAVYEPLIGQERKSWLIEYSGGYRLPYMSPISNVADLPADLEQACIDMVITKKAMLKHPGNIASEGLGSWSVSYSGTEVSEGVREALAYYARLTQA
jgi:hypothetical protein